jgi:hypothetical protein
MRVCFKLIAVCIVGEANKHMWTGSDFNHYKYHMDHIPYLVLLTRLVGRQKEGPIRRSFADFSRALKPSPQMLVLTSTAKLLN